MIQILDTRLNVYMELTTAQANSLNVCRELMLQAVTYAKDRKNVDSFFTLARVERDSHIEYSPTWSLCENAISDANTEIIMLIAKREHVRLVFRD